MKATARSNQARRFLQLLSIKPNRLLRTLPLALALGLILGCAAAKPNQTAQSGQDKTHVATSGVLPQVIDSQRESGHGSAASPSSQSTGVSEKTQPTPQAKGGKPMPVTSTQMLSLQSPAFHANQPIPEKYTCDGVGISPPLHISNVPAKAQTLALIVDDPDAPHGTFTHWLLWNIPASIREIDEAQPPINAVEGTNDFHKLGYGGPCPPSGTHRYRFKLYALDTELNLPQGASLKELERAMRPHVLTVSALVGIYHRK